MWFWIHELGSHPHPTSVCAQHGGLQPAPVFVCRSRSTCVRPWVHARPSGGDGGPRREGHDAGAAAGHVDPGTSQHAGGGSGAQVLEGHVVVWHAGGSSGAQVMEGHVVMCGTQGVLVVHR